MPFSQSNRIRLLVVSDQYILQWNFDISFYNPGHLSILVQTKEEALIQQTPNVSQH